MGWLVMMAMSRSIEKIRVKRIIGVAIVFFSCSFLHGMMQDLRGTYWERYKRNNYRRRTLSTPVRESGNEYTILRRNHSYHNFYPKKNKQSFFKNFPIHSAAFYGDIKGIEKNAQSIFCCNNFGQNVLHLTLLGGYITKETKLKVIEKIFNLIQNCSVETRQGFINKVCVLSNNRYASPLNIALSKGYVDIASFFIDKGVDVISEDSSQTSAHILFSTTRMSAEKKIKMFKKIVDKFESEDEKSRFFNTVKKDWYGVPCSVSELAKNNLRKSRSESCIESMSKFASKKKKRERDKICSNLGLVLSVAIKNGELSLAKLLINKGACLDISADKTVLHEIFLTDEIQDEDRKEIVKSVLEKINKYQYEDKIEFLDKRWKDFDGKTYLALDLAVKSTNFDIANLLDDAGASARRIEFH